MSATGPFDELRLALGARIADGLLLLREFGLKSAAHSPWLWPNSERLSSDYVFALAFAMHDALEANGAALPPINRKRAEAVTARTFACAGVMDILERTAEGLSADDLAALVIAGSRLQRNDEMVGRRPNDVLWGPNSRRRGRPAKPQYATDDALVAEAHRRILADENPTTVWRDVAARAEPPGDMVSLQSKVARLKERRKLQIN